MPQAIPIIVGYLASEGAAAAGYSAYAAYIGAAAAAATAAAQSSVEQRKARKRAQAARRDLTVMLQTGSGPRRTVYGRAKVSGPLVYAYSNGDEHKFMHRIIVLTGHEIDGYDRVYFNDDDITADLVGLPSTGGFSSATTGGRYMWGALPVAHVVGYPGTTTQAADSTLVVQSGGQWSNDHRLLGCAYVRVQNNYEPIVYTEGLPNPAFVIRGKKLYDGRTGLTVFSANPALVIRDYLINELGVPTARIDQASFDAAANVCDEYITVNVASLGDPAGWAAYLNDMAQLGLWESTGGGIYRQRRYTFNGVVEADDSPGEVLDQMTQTCAGWLSYTGGAWRLVAGSYTAPTLTLGESDLRAAPSYRPRPSRRQCFNVVRGTYLGPATNYVATDFPAPISTAYVTQDGGSELPLDVDLPFTNDGMTAQRIAGIMLSRARQGVLVFPATLTGLALRPGDTVAINLPRFGFSGKVFRVEGWALSEDYGVDLVLREDAAGYYSWTPYGPLYDQSPELNLPNPWVVPSMSGLSATSGVHTSLVQNDGTIIQRTLVSWTPTTNAFARLVQIETRQVGETAWTPQPDVEDSAGQTYLLNLRTGVSHEIRARRVNTVGSVGPWSTINHAPAKVNVGANLLGNSDWTDDLGYAVGASFVDSRALRLWTSNGNPALYGRNYDGGKSWNLGAGGAWFYIPSNTVGHYACIYQDIPVVAGVAYEASVYVSIHRAIAQIQIQFLDASKITILGNPADAYDSVSSVIGSPYDITTHRRLWCSGVAPTNTVYARVICLVQCTSSSSPYPFTAWSKALLCVAPTGVTRDTATPWSEGNPPTVDGGSLTPGTVTDVLEALPADGAQNHVNNNPGFTPDWTDTFATVTYTNTTPRSVNVVVSYSALLGFFVASGTNQMFFGKVTVNNNGAVSVLAGIDGSFGQLAQTAGPGHLLSGISNVIAVAAGTTLTVTMSVRVGRLSAGTLDVTAYWGAVRLNLQGIRK